MIETDTGVWDARLETQLQRLRDAIDSSVKSGS
jgi:flagellar biosynthesis/type III secretory pathway protein FliH